jgi:DnaK suppressor protein
LLQAAIVNRAAETERTGKNAMTDMQVGKFRDLLAARQRELEGLIRNREAAAIETSADALDQIQHMVERELALETLGRESAFLRETRSALRRIDEGVFGMCLDCEEEISPKRLAAVPWASRCIACQERADREGVHNKNGDDELLAEAA